MAIAHFSAQIINATRSVVDAAAYRHRTRLVDELKGSSTRDYSAQEDLVHEEVMIPDNPPRWISDMVDGVAPARASEAIWNKVSMEERANGQLAREIILALPLELTREENIALMREFVTDQVTSRGMVADWVYHDAPGNPHVHLMHTLRPVEERGFGKKKIAVLDENGEPLRVGARIVYQTLVGGIQGLKEWRDAWGDVVNHHLALAGHEARIDMRSFLEQGIDLAPTHHLGPAGTAIKQKIGESEILAKREAVRRETADQIMAKPDELLKLINRERSTFSERDIAKTLHRFIDEPETYAKVRAQVMASSELVELRGAVSDPETGKTLAQPVYSTREMVRIEHDMAIAADRLNATTGFGVSKTRVAGAIRAVETKDPSRPFRFDDEQVLAVEHVTANSGIAAVVGYAGAGKSTLLEAANVAWTADGKRVFGAALAGKAAEGLEESAGIQSRTLASWELSWKNGRDLLQPGDVFVIDEAGMVSSNQLSRFVTTIEQAGAKAVLVGDAMQLQPIEAGAAFRAITERVGYVELVGVRRQKEAWAQDASRQFARGEVANALEAYRDRGHIREAENSQEVVKAIVADWAKARAQAIAGAQSSGKALKGDELLVLAHTNASVFALNTAIREVMKDDNALTEARAFVTERGTREFAVGDRIIFLKNEKFQDALAPELGEQRVKNGMLGNVIATASETGQPMLRVRLDNGREVAFGAETYRNVDHGYAATVHKSQGVTVDRVFVMASKSMDQHLSYVAMSRHRHQVTLYASHEEFGARSSGRLVEHGVAPFEHDATRRDSYYVTLENDAGARHTTWGVGLKSAIEAAKPAIGDRINLRHEGTEQVVLPDGTGTHRNAWSVSTGSQKLFDNLARSMGRSGAKTTTLDYADKQNSRHVSEAFATRRGIETLASIAPSFAAYVERQSAWIAQKREQLGELWARVEEVIGRTREQDRSIEPESVAGSHERHRPEASQAVSVEKPVVASQVPLFAAATSFADSIEEAARASVMQAPGYRSHLDTLAKAAGQIWQDPDAAIAKIERTIVTTTEPGKLTALLKDDPTRAGVLRGSDRLLDRFSAAGAERKAALQAMPEALAAIGKAESAWRTMLQNQLALETANRERMKIEIPAPSQAADATLRGMSATKGYDAMHEAVARMSPALKAEFATLNRALEKRFGPKAFEKDNPDLARQVAPAERQRFAETAKQMKIVQQIVRTDIEQRRQAERIQKSLSRGNNLRQ